MLIEKYGPTDKLQYDIRTHYLTHFILTTRDIYTKLLTFYES